MSGHWCQHQSVLRRSNTFLIKNINAECFFEEKCKSKDFMFILKKKSNIESNQKPLRCKKLQLSQNGFQFLNWNITIKISSLLKK